MLKFINEAKAIVSAVEDRLGAGLFRDDIADDVANALEQSDTDKGRMMAVESVFDAECERLGESGWNPPPWRRN
jgi:hypothetical protein